MLVRVVTVRKEPEPFSWAEVGGWPWIMDAGKGDVMGWTKEDVIGLMWLGCIQSSGTEGLLVSLWSPRARPDVV